MKNILVINNNPNNSEGIYTPILIIKRILLKKF